VPNIGLQIIQRQDDTARTFDSLIAAIATSAISTIPTNAGTISRPQITCRNNGTML
jgi:hypothetical protein